MPKNVLPPAEESEAVVLPDVFLQLVPCRKSEQESIVTDGSAEGRGKTDAFGAVRLTHLHIIANALHTDITGCSALAALSMRSLISRSIALRLRPNVHQSRNRTERIDDLDGGLSAFSMDGKCS